MSNGPVPLAVPGVTEPLTSRPINTLLLTATLCRWVLGVGGVAVAGRRPGRKRCEWFADNGVIGVTGVLWLNWDVCVNGVWLWLACDGLLLLLWWLSRCKWVGLIIPANTTKKIHQKISKNFENLISEMFRNNASLPFWFWYKCECICCWGWIGCDELIVLIGVCCAWCWAGGLCEWFSCWLAVRFRFNGFWLRTHIVFSFCQTNTLWTMAQPQNTMPMPIKMLVMIAGVEWNCVNVYRMMPKRE